MSKSSQDKILRQGKSKGNFLLKILYTQNNDIQGTILWLEEEKTVNFRSFLELTTLLSEAVGLLDDGPLFHTWEYLDQQHIYKVSQNS
jgi:hypothetical protein